MISFSADLLTPKIDPTLGIHNEKVVEFGNSKIRKSCQTCVNCRLVKVKSGMSVVQNEMIMHCFDVLICRLKQLPIPDPEFDQLLERYD